MFKSHLQNILLNFSAILLLGALIAAPIYFAKNITKVAGVKSQSPYLLLSQVEKFPQMSLTQTGSKYSLSFTKQAQKQAYQSVFILNNPTNETKTYQISNESESNSAFFGEDISRIQTKITLPAKGATSISIISNSSQSSDMVKFSLENL